MRSKAKSVEECTTLFEIEVMPATIERALDEVYVEITKVANIPGFRVGKAPIEMVKRQYVKDAREEVLKRLIPDAYRKAVLEHKIDPVGLPEISEISFEEGKALTFKARVDTRPKFKLKTYKGVPLERKKTVIADDEIAKTLESLRALNAKYVTVDRAVQMGDYVVSDLECTVDGKPAHKKRENLWLTVDKESLMPALTESLVGMKKGEEKDVEAKLPDNYPNKELAGKAAVYHVLAKEIKERQLPAVDDSFAKDLGKDTLEELRKAIAEELGARAKANAQTDVENQLLNRLMDENAFNVPPSFVARQLEYMVEDAKRRLEQKGFRKEDLDKKDGEFREKFKNDAARQVRLLFILDEIAAAEKIEATDEDLNGAYQAIAAQSGKGMDEVKRQYEKEELDDNLREKVREAKTIKFLLDNAKITEKD